MVAKIVSDVQMSLNLVNVINPFQLSVVFYIETSGIEMEIK